MENTFDGDGQVKHEIKFFDLKKFDLKRSLSMGLSETRNLEVTKCDLKLHMPFEPFRAI